MVCASLCTLTPYPLSAELAAIHFYQAHLSRTFGYVARCRFNPTCSHYAVQRLETEGFWLGNAKIAGRLILCSPIGFVIDQFRDEAPGKPAPAGSAGQAS